MTPWRRSDPSRGRCRRPEAKDPSLNPSALAAAAMSFGALLAVAHPAPAADPGRPNVLRLVMHTPHGGFTRMVVSVTVCEPGSGRCATVDDVLVDTGSTGLRLEASAVPT